MNASRVIAVLLTAAWIGGGCSTAKPKPAPEPAPAAREVIIIRADGSLTVNGKTIKPEEVAAKLKQLGVDTAAAVKIRAKKTAPYKHVAALLKRLQKEGYRKVSFRTEEE
jgi:biopolymer transport protein ExbD